MTNEEYLVACGWTRIDDKWMRNHLPSTSDWYQAWTTEEALARQLRDDRERLGFVFSRSVAVATWPDGKTLTVDLKGTSVTWSE